MSECGCSLVHLSNLHDWKTVDPMQSTSFMAQISQVDVIMYINQYHMANLNEDSTFEDVAQYLPHVFDKIKANLEYYLTELEDK